MRDFFIGVRQWRMRVTCDRARPGYSGLFHCDCEKNVTECLERIFFVEVHEASITSGKRPLNCLLEKAVQLHGRQLKIEKELLCIHKPIPFKCDTKKDTVNVTAHSLNANASGYLTTDGFLLNE